MVIKKALNRRMCFIALAAFSLVLVPLTTVRVYAVSDDSQPVMANDDTPTVRTQTERRVSDMRTTVEKEVEQKRESKVKSDKADEKRRLVCENRQNAINNKLAAFTQAADKHLVKLNDAYTAVQNYQRDHLLPVANYRELNAAAFDKQQAAITAVGTLKTVAQSIDCAKTDAAVKLSTVRDAANDARRALHDYRVSIKEIVVALVQAEDAVTVPEETVEANE